MRELPPLPDDLPWMTPAYLLLDGVSVPNLVQRLHCWGNPTYCLYLNTRWHELSDISPCLLVLSGRDDPLLAYFQEHAALEWGYLLFSDDDVHALLSHWRHLLSVEQADGVEVMPRIADPAVMHQLFSVAVQDRSARWFGPVTHVCLPDGVEGSWRQHARTLQACAEPKTYRLSDQELTALGDVEFRNAVSGLCEHLHRYFPDFMATFAPSARRQYVQEMTEQAYQQGFCSDQELALYANVFGYLTRQPLTDHPDIAALLAKSTPDAPLSRVKRAAELAERRAIDRKGSLL
ncbi:DUF4123 domain-containing protein [Pseudomonas sp. BBP2017]|uniref:DUF4123 domain-containing protein n=1 Tax=Pseudomonas sp. BBP2017 TaxID=2109731 RepID=UPI000D126096|nr:DUF4123 domain-containing protein [Pseudomonas sp. BBP2017]PSS53796.1 DUF4123 domain-containing protein [Pseudomonas sp. BBP2017]